MNWGILRKLRQVSHDSGRSLASLIFELTRLRVGKTRLGADDYYLYQLYDDTQYSFREKSEFVGWRFAAKIDSELNDDNWRVYANDKVEFARAMMKKGLSTPDIVAIYGGSGAPLPGAESLQDKAELSNFLRDHTNYPLFCKPVHGTYGRGGFSALSYDATCDQIMLGDDSMLSIRQAVDQCSEGWACGYLMQKLLVPHPHMESIVGSRLSSLRIIVLLTPRGPILFRGVWKLPTGSNMSDNFMHGQLGNLIADVDVHTGEISHALGVQLGELEVVPLHPDTGASLADLRVPLWSQVVQYCTSAASLFPGLAMQHWDIALTPDGPVALEVNVEGSLDLHQLAGSRGIYDQTLRDLIREKSDTALEP